MTEIILAAGLPEDALQRPYRAQLSDVLLASTILQLFFQTPIMVFYSRRIGGNETITSSDNQVSLDALKFPTKLNSALKYTFKNTVFFSTYPH